MAVSVSVKLGILALLNEEERCGYQLHAAFAERTGNHWPLNPGQVYSTLQRLERDGLAEVTASDDDGRQFYAITDTGRDELGQWFSTPIARADRPRDDLAIKLAVAAAAGADIHDVVQRQRAAAMHDLQELTWKKSQQLPGTELASALTLESLVFQVEAEIRWLDHCEALLTKGAVHDRAGV